MTTNEVKTTTPVLPPLANERAELQYKVRCLEEIVAQLLLENQRLRQQLVLQS